MSAIQLYVDEDAAESAVVESLRQLSINVLTTAEAGMDSESDEAQLLFATSQDRTIYTLNVGDYCALHTAFVAAGRRHAGIVVIPRQRYSIGEKVRRLSRF